MRNSKPIIVDYQITIKPIERVLGGFGYYIIIKDEHFEHTNYYYSSNKRCIERHFKRNTRRFNLVGDLHPGSSYVGLALKPNIWDRLLTKHQEVVKS